MGYGDTHTLLSDDQDIGQTANTYVSTNKYDLGVKGTPILGGPLQSDIGTGNPIMLEITITEAVTSGGAATVNIQVGVDDDAAFGSPTIFWETGATTYSDFTLGKKFKVMVPPGIADAGRYLGAQYVIAAATTTAGTVTTEVLLASQSNLLSTYALP